VGSFDVFKAGRLDLFVSDTMIFCSLFFVAFNIGIGSVRIGFIFSSLSLSGVIQVELGIIIAVLSFLTGKILSFASPSTESGVNFGTVCFSPERTCGNTEDELDEIFDAAAIMVDVIGECVEIWLSVLILFELCPVILSGLIGALLLSCWTAFLIVPEVSCIDCNLIGLELAVSEFFIPPIFDFVYFDSIAIG
jgi:hypothetical protein